MGKSKTVGNKNLIIKNAEEKKIDREELFSTIEQILYPMWEEHSETSMLLTQKYKCWTDLIKILYHSKMLNITETYNQIKYAKEKEN